MPNSDCPSRRWAARARAAHCACPVGGQLDDVGRARQRRADVEHHLDVGPEQLLGRHRRLRGQPVLRAVVDAAERDAVVVDVRSQREHLEPAGVGQRQAVPAGEPADAAEAGDDLGAGAQHEVVRVGQHDLDAEALVVGGAEVLDGATRPDRHEARRAVRAAGRRGDAGAGGAVLGDDLERDRVQGGDANDSSVLCVGIAHNDRS